MHTLQLSGNRIENVSDGAFAGFQNLTYLHLNSNRIKKIVFMVKDIPKLKKIFLENNQLTHLSTFYGFFMVFEELYLSGTLYCISTEMTLNILQILKKLIYQIMVSYHSNHNMNYLVLDL